jgi:hypothetical protein
MQLAMWPLLEPGVWVATPSSRGSSTGVTLASDGTAGSVTWPQPPRGSVPSSVTLPDLKRRRLGRGRSAPQHRCQQDDVRAAHVRRQRSTPGSACANGPEVGGNRADGERLCRCAAKNYLRLDLSVRDAQVQRGKARASAGPGRIPSAARIAFTTSSCWAVVMVANSGRDTARAP